MSTTLKTCLAALLTASALAAARAADPPTTTAPAANPPTTTAPADMNRQPWTFDYGPVPSAGYGRTLPANASNLDFVRSTIEAIGSNESIQLAEDTLATRGPELLPALRAAMPAANQDGRTAIVGAILRLTWDIHPRQLVANWIRKSVRSSYVDVISNDVRPLLIYDDSLVRAAPNHAFYLVAYRQHPRPDLNLSPMSFRNIFMIDRRGGLQLITTGPELDRALAAALLPVRNDVMARDALLAALRLDTELAQDGMYRIELPTGPAAVRRVPGGIEVAGFAQVAAGGTGRIGLTLSFTSAGRLAGVERANTVRPGARP